jgi:hypothetical protein
MGWLFYRAVGTKPITKRGDAVWAPGGVVGTVLAMFCSYGTTDPVRHHTLVEKKGWLFYRAVGTKPITKQWR